MCSTKTILLGFLIIGVCHTAISKPSTPSADEAKEESVDFNEAGEYNEDSGDNSVTLPYFEHRVVNKLVKVDDDIVIECGATDLSVENVISWYNQTKAISKNNNVTSNDPRISIGDEYSLRIEGVRATDAGQYNRTVFRNDISSENISLQVNLEVESKPTAVILDKDGRDISGLQMNYHQGDRIEIVCIGIGNPTPEIKWYSNGERVLSGNNVRIDNGQLIIDRADHHHVKLYQCLADNGKDVAGHASITINVLHSPIVSSHRHVVYTKDGDDAVLHCNYKSTTASNVVWFKSEVQLPLINVDKYSTSNEIKEEHHESSILTIKNIKQNDLGDYKCEVRNEIGKESLKIHLGYEPEPPKLEQYDIEGDTVITHWTVHSLQPLNEVLLKYQKSGERIWVPDKHVHSEMNSGIWRFTYRSLMDAGTWNVRMQAKNVAGWSLRSQEEKIVVPTIVSKPSTPSADEEGDENKSGQTKKDDDSVRPPPSFEHSLVRKLVKVDDDIVIECDAKDLSVEDVILWYNQTKPISHNKFVISTDPRISISDDYSLRINGVRATDAGQYNCTVIPNIVLMQVNLEVESKTAMTAIIDKDGRDISGRQVNYKQGDRIEIQCEGTGNPRPQVKWFSNGERVTSGNDVQINNGLLLIDPADHDHAKTYQCLADNGKDVAAASITINVLFSSHRQIVNTKQGGDAVLHCNYKSTASSIVDWFKNEEMLSISNTNKYGTSNKGSTLVIKNIEGSDLGDYTCEVRNVTEKGNVKIHLGYEPEPPTLERYDIEGDAVITHWKIHSLQPLNGVVLNYQESGDKGWQVHIEKSEKHLDLWRIQHKISLDTGTFNARLKAKNTFGWSLYSQEERIVVPIRATKEESKDDVENKSDPTIEDDNSVHTPPSFEHSVVRKLVKVDDDIVIECGAKDLSVGHVILWYSQTKAISTNKYVLTADPRVTIGDDYSLRINGVRATDAGQYNCTILPDNIAMQVNLEVESKPTAVILDKEGRNISGRQLNYKDGDRIEIQCKGTGNLTSEGKWYSNGGRVTSGNNVHINNGQLIIAHADHDHAKMYQCLADNGKDVAGHASITINVLYSPIVSSYRRVVNTKDGGDAVLHCNYKSTTASKVVWLKNEAQLPINNVDKYSTSNESKEEHHESSILVIKNVERNDLGDYVCKVQNTMGEGNVNIHLGYEPVAPTFERYDIDEDKVFTYWKVHSLQPLDEILLNYKKSEDRYWLTEKPIHSEKSKHHSDVWIIEHKISWNAGTWNALLKAKNADGWSVYSQEETIVVPTTISKPSTPSAHQAKEKSEYVGDDDYIYNDEDDENKSGETSKDNNSVRNQPSFEHSVVNRSAKIDDDIVIECGAKGLVVKNVIVWYNHTKLICQDKYVISTDPRISIGDDYSLRINGVRATDAGQYTCTILPDNIAMQVNLEVEGKSAAAILDMDGRDISGRQLNYKQGARIEIQCEAEGNPTAQIKWFSEGGRVKSGNNMQVNNESLIIANADNDHAKMYQCLADPGYAFVTINVLSLPIVSSHRPIINTKDGDDAVLHCNYKSTTASEVNWFKNEKLLPKNNVDKYMITNDSRDHESSILMIKNIERSDLSDYRCEVRNAIGKVKVNFHLGYEPVPPTFERYDIDGDKVFTYWEIHSLQPLNEALLNYRKSGDRTWVTEKPVHSEKSKEQSGIWSIQHKILLHAGTWNARMKTKNAAGWSLYSREETIVVPTSNYDF